MSTAPSPKIRKPIPPLTVTAKDLNIKIVTRNLIHRAAGGRISRRRPCRTRRCRKVWQSLKITFDFRTGKRRCQLGIDLAEALASLKF